MVLFAGKLYKRVSLFTLSLVLAISGLVVAAPLYFNQVAHAAEPWTVNTSYLDDSECASPIFQCATIQAAIDVANPNDTILVSGTFGSIDAYTAYNITAPNVTIRGVSGNKVYGTFNLKGDGDTLDSLNVYSKGGGSDSLKNAVNVVSKSVNITNSRFELANPNAVSAGGGVGNGVVIWPYGSATPNLNITGNTFVGYGATVPNWSSTSLLIAEETNLARFGIDGISSIITIVNEQALTTGNTFTGNSYDYVHQNWGSGGGDWSYSRVSNSAGLTDAIDNSAAEATILVAAGTYNESLDISKPLTILGAGQANTFIDQSANAAAGNVVSIHDLSGNVKVDGFTIKTGPASSVASNGVNISGLTGPGTITISNNTIWGVQSATATTKGNFGLIAGYFTATTPKLVFDHNIVHGGSDNPILIEKWMGPTEITNNTLYQNPQKDFSASDVIFMMNYGGSHNNAKQLISGNIIDMGWGTTNQTGAGISIAGSYYGTGAGGFTNLEISSNNIINLKPSRRGISLWNNSSNGTDGDITNALISLNTISSATGYVGEFGIRELGKITGTQITNNTISGVIDALKLQPWNENNNPSGSVVHKNSLVATTLGVNNLTTNVVDATNNWWGNASGPYDNKTLVGTTPNYNNPSGTGSPVTSYVDYKPWFTDAAMTTLSSANAITVAASGITLADATLNGTNGSYDAIDHTFWVSLSNFVPALPVPVGIYSTPSLGPISADASFTPTLLSSLTIDGVPSNLPAITPNTTYYYAAWSEVGGTWYPGEVKTFTTAPSIPTNGTPNNSYKKTNDFNFNWDALTSNGIVTYEFQSSLNSAQSDDGVLTTGVWSSGILPSNTIHSTGAPDGTWYWQVRAINSIGGKSAWSPIWKMTIDSKVPTVAITAPSVGQVLNGRTVTINGTATDSNFNYYYCYITNANGEVGTRDAQCETAWWAGAPFHNNVFAETTNGTTNSHLGTISFSNSLPDDNYVVHLVAKDKAGNSAEVTQSFILDNTAPNANITSPLVGGYARRTIDITGTFSDNNHEFNGIYMGFTGNDKTGNQLSWCHSEAPGFGITDGTRTCSFDTTKLSDGSHKIEIWAMDKAGNWGTGSGQSINVMVDNTAPTVILSKPAIDSLTGSWTPKVDAGDATSYLWTADTSNPAELAFTATDKEPTFTPSVDGEYAFTLVATDAAGNTSDAATFSFSYAAPIVASSVAPTPAIAAVTAPAPLPQNLVAFTATPAAADDTAALGATTTKDAPAVAGVQTKKTASILGDTTSKNNGTIWGLAWYWWLVILAAVAAIIWWIVAAMRSRDNQNA